MLAALVQKEATNCFRRFHSLVGLVLQIQKAQSSRPEQHYYLAEALLELVDCLVLNALKITLSITVTILVNSCRFSVYYFIWTRWLLKMSSLSAALIEA